MANKTVKEARSIHGTNPQYLIEKIIRTRIYDSKYWKEDCFALNMHLLVDKAVDLRFIGGIYGGNIKASPFICLILKMLQIQPEEDILDELIDQEHFKYLRALGAFYLRLTGNSLKIYKKLEPLLNDYRQIRCINRMGKFNIIHVDEFIDNLLREDRYLDVILPRISKRILHEEIGELEPKVFLIDNEINDEHIDYSSEEESKPIIQNETIDRIKSRKYGKKTEDDEIEEANRLRASLGLKPLKR